jgi:hypothetical protein
MKLRKKMSRVEEMVEEMRTRRGITVEDREGAWLIRVPRRPDLECEIIFPKAAERAGFRPNFVWFASVNRIADGEEVWSDSQEYLGASHAQHDIEMASHLHAFIERVADADRVLSIWEPRA